VSSPSRGAASMLDDVTVLAIYLFAGALEARR
jgi:hypothetical protein